MKHPVPFIGGLPKKEQKQWQALLNHALPEEEIKLPDELSPSQRQASEIAIVANPNMQELQDYPNLKWVHSVWAGVEKMLKNTEKLPFKIVRLIDENLAETMAEAALAWTLYLHRDMPKYARQQQQKHWHQYPYHLACQRRVGILGLGELGRAAASRLLANDFQVFGWSRSEKQIPKITTYKGNDGLKTMLKQTDILICLLPLTPHTLGLLDETRLSQLPPNASLINFARGPIVKSDALLNLLDNQHLSHAVLDVFDEEPLSTSSPLWEHPRVTVLPHVAAPTDQVTAGQIVARNIRHYRQTGQLPPTVDIERGY